MRCLTLLLLAGASLLHCAALPRPPAISSPATLSRDTSQFPSGLDTAPAHAELTPSEVTTTTPPPLPPLLPPRAVDAPNLNFTGALPQAVLIFISKQPPIARARAYYIAGAVVGSLAFVATYTTLAGCMYHRIAARRQSWVGTKVARVRVVPRWWRDRRGKAGREKGKGREGAVSEDVQGVELGPMARGAGDGGGGGGGV